MDDKEKKGYKENIQLQIDCWDSLDFLVKHNKECAKEFEANKDKMTAEEKKDFIAMGKNNIDIYHAIKTIYLKYKENPTQELEDEIKGKFGALIKELLEARKKFERVEEAPVKSTPIVEEKTSSTEKTDEEIMKELDKEFDSIPSINRAIDYETGDIIEKPIERVPAGSSEAPKPLERAVPATPKKDVIVGDEPENFDDIFGPSL